MEDWRHLFVSLSLYDRAPGFGEWVEIGHLNGVLQNVSAWRDRWTTLRLVLILFDSNSLFFTEMCELWEDMYGNSEHICDKDFCEHPIVLAIQTIPVSLAPFLTFQFRCLELVLAAITVPRGRSQSVLCVSHSCGSVCLASLMSAGAWLKIILTFFRISVAEKPSFSDGLCMHREKKEGSSLAQRRAGGKLDVFPQFPLVHGVLSIEIQPCVLKRRQAQACLVSQAWQGCKKTPALPSSHRG